MRIRLAEASDISAAAQLWFDRVTLLQQTDPGIQLLPDARAQWSAAAASWISEERTRFLVAEDKGRLIGFSVVRIAAGRPGLKPPCRGIMLEMALDLHETHRGLSEQLLERVKRWLAEMGATQLEIEAPARYPVEAAYWRAQGGAPRAERLVLPL